MKHLLMMFCLGFGLLATVQAQIPEARVDKLDLDLYETMQENPLLLQEIIVLLEDQVNMDDLNRKLKIQQASLHERRVTVVTILQEKAHSTQGPLLTLLQQTPGVDQGSINPLWITNAITLRADATAIAILSQRPEVAALGIVEKYETLGTYNEQTSAAVPNGREVTHDKINAVDLWRLGYTGANEKILVIDDGLALESAIEENYLGLYEPDNVSWYTPGASSEPIDCGSHGTNVGGSAFGLDRVTHDTVGVAPNAFVMGSVLGTLTGIGNVCPQVAGLDAVTIFQWAMNPDGNVGTTDDVPIVVNNSWGSGWRTGNGTLRSCSEAYRISMRNSIIAMSSAGIAVIMGAGNDGAIDPSINVPEEVIYPAAAIIDTFNAFSVGAVIGGNATNNTFPISNFSSRGPSFCDVPVGASPDLKIKPEVMAPGVRIRTQSPGGNFVRVDGTSFSAPITSGAVALLHEAFPQLTGLEILRALYYSATDLGAVGEDNLYGNGIINIKGAYDWLRAQGHDPFKIPETPDVELVSIDAPAVEKVCDTAITFILTVANHGDRPATSLDFDYTATNGITGSLNWTGNIAAGATATINIPTTLPLGFYSMDIRLMNTNGQPDYVIPGNLKSVEFSIVSDNPITTQEDVPVCATDGDVFLTATAALAGSEVRWYDDIGPNRTLLNIGESYYLENVTPSTLYVSAFTKAEVGVADNTVGTGTYSPQTNGAIVFDVNTAFTLESVKMIALRPGTQIIELRDASGTVLNSTSAVVGTSLQEVPLGFELLPGIDYELGLSSASAGELYYTFSGIQFPFSDPNGSITLKEGKQGSLSNQVFYYFYDWKIGLEGSCEPAPVNLQLVSNAVIADFTADRNVIGVGGNVNFTDATQPAVNADSWMWDFGDGQTSTLQNPSHTYAQEGTYTVTLTTFSPQGANFCGDADTMSIVVSKTVGNNPFAEARQLTIVPNPSTGVFTLSWEGQPKQADLEIVDMLGKTLLTLPSNTNQVVLDLSEYPSGVYYLRVYEGSRTYVQKLMKE